MSIHTQNTPNSTRHVGTCGDKRVAVIIQDPQATYEVHVVDTDSLPDAYHQNLMDLLMRPEAQASKWLGEYLHRQMLFDGTNALRQFYDKGWIKQVPVTSVYLTPRPNQRISLAEALGVMINDPNDPNNPMDAQYNPLGAQQPQSRTQEPNYNDIVAREQEKLNQYDPMNPLANTPPPPVNRYNQHQENLRGDFNENNRLMARNLIEEAKMLETDAQTKRNLAAQYDPNTLSQATTYSPSVSLTSTSESYNPLQSTKVPVISESPSETHVDSVTGKSYSTVGALKGAITRRENAAKKAGNG